MKIILQHISAYCTILNQTKIMKILLKMLIKIKIVHTFKLYSDYFKMVNLIQAKDTSTIFKIKIAYLNMLIKILHYMVLYCIDDSLSPAEHLMHFDIIFVEKLSSFLNLYIALNYFLIAKVFKLLFYKNNGVLGQFFRRVILQESDNTLKKSILFTKYYFKFSPLTNKIFLTLFKYNVNEHKIEPNLQKFTQIALHCIDAIGCIYGKLTVF